jgi:hypothetical protein
MLGLFFLVYGIGWVMGLLTGSLLALNHTKIQQKAKAEHDLRQQKIRDLYSNSKYGDRY